MTTKEVDLNTRIQALNCAVGHRLSTESAATVVENAEKYLAFLAGSETKTDDVIV